MVAEIVRLETRAHTTPMVAGIVFPQLYRLERPRTFQVFYSLQEDKTGIACRAIDRLDPNLDAGWILIRHHDSLQSAHGYLDARTDAFDRHLVSASVFPTKQGFFTLGYRPRPKRKYNHLIIYIAKEPGLAAIAPNLRDRYRIVHADGQVTHDYGALLLPQD